MKIINYSGVENAWLYNDGWLDIFGYEVMGSNLDATTGEIVGIRLSPEYALMLLDLLLANEDNLLTMTFGEEEEEDA